MTIAAPVMIYVVDPLERAGRSFIQQFAVFLLGGGAAGLLFTQNWLLAADSAAFAAVMSILTSVLTFTVPVLPAWLDLVLRVVKTFGQSFVGTLAASKVLSVTGADWRGALAVAVPVAFTALLTGLAAFGIPTTVGASLLPAGLTTAVIAAGGDGQVEVDVQAEQQRVSVQTSETTTPT